MNKKILMGLGAALAVVASVAAMSAYEAHVINVTAHIENALTTHGDPLHFGTVFPQEYLTKNFTVSLSSSFQTSGRDDYVTYKIVQKAKCECDAWGAGNQQAVCGDEQYAALHYATHECPADYTKMKDLCKFLSKLPEEGEGDSKVPSYYIVGDPDSCYTVADDPRPEHAYGMLWGLNDLADQWIIDLKVPPVDGYIGQDWPESCAEWTVPVDGADYGCDLWLEVTCIGDAQDCLPFAQ